MKNLSNHEQCLKEELIKKRKAGLEKLPSYRGEVPTKSALRKLPGLQPGEIFWITSDEYSVLVEKIENGSVHLKALDENATLSSGLTLYDMNVKGVEKEPLFDWEDAEKVAEIELLMRNFVERFFDTNFLLYGRHINYFTMFSLSEFRPFHHLKEFKSVLDNIGNLVSIDDDGDQGLEIWIKDANNTPQLLYFFPCDQMIVNLI